MILGVIVVKYLRMVLNVYCESCGEVVILLKDFCKIVEVVMEFTYVLCEFFNCYFNDGFFGGEKKRMEILQLALLQLTLAVFDETDFGFDIDVLNMVAYGVNMVAQDLEMGVLIIMHYQCILHMVKLQFVHIFFEGWIVKEGGFEFVEMFEK